MQSTNSAIQVTPVCYLPDEISQLDIVYSCSSSFLYLTYCEQVMLLMAYMVHVATVLLSLTLNIVTIIYKIITAPKRSIEISYILLKYYTQFQRHSLAILTVLLVMMFIRCKYKSILYYTSTSAPIHINC